MKKIIFVISLVISTASLFGQTANTLPLPAGETVVGGHLHVGAGNEVWSDATSLYFNYSGSAAATHFWNLGGTNGKSILTLLNNGNIGIGTTNPAYPLEIKGGSLFVHGSNGGEGRLVMQLDGYNQFEWYPQSTGLFCYNRTSNNYPITFLNNGNVGIGTNSPAYKLSVNGGISTNSPSNLVHSGNEITLLNGYSQNSVWLNYRGSSAKLSYRLGSGLANGTYGDMQLDNLYANGNVGVGTTSPMAKITSVAPVNNYSAFFGYGSESSGDIGGVGFITDGSSFYKITTDWWTTVKNLPLILGTYLNNSNQLVLATSGNVGIGTSTPTFQLEVNTASSASLFKLNRGGIPIAYITASNNDLELSSLTNNMRFDVPNGKVYSFSTGNVGIGTTNPQSKLAVNGVITAKEINVTLDGWADFVFKPNYTLRPLSEVEQFIKANNHLPEIPSEAEVKENGVSLGEMNAKLLQKVEELTLYVIDLQKQVDELKKSQNNIK